MIAMAAQLFISYARKDRDHVLPWVQALQALGVSVWMDERGLDGAVLWQQEIVEAIDGCALLLLMLSPTAVGSRSVQREVTLAIEANKPVLPLILEPVQIPAALRYQLAGIQHIDLFAGDREEKLQAITRSLNRCGIEIQGSDVVTGLPAGGRGPEGDLPAGLDPAECARMRVDPGPPTLHLRPPTTGVVALQIHTYVFTDLEDSTGLTRALPTSVWRRLKERHDELVRECATAAGGQVVKSLGDGFLAVFPNEEPAIRFAIAVQRALRSEPRGEQVSLEVRIGMDTGPAVFIPDPPDYDGDALNVASRICARARPGEVLLSARSYFGARPSLDRLGSEVRLEPAGEIQFKGLSAPEPLYRAWAPGLREGFPPLTRAGNLAAYRGAAPFIGREALLTEVATALRAHPVVTLLGPGGIGKTRLSLEAGSRVEAEFPAGVWVAPLETVRRGAAVAAELLATLGMSADGTDPREALLRYLGDWHGLLILDNVEQLVDEESGDFTRLLAKIARQCQRARLLCTSRVDLRLGVSVEAPIEIPPLRCRGRSPRRQTCGTAPARSSVASACGCGSATSPSTMPVRLMSPPSAGPPKACRCSSSWPRDSWGGGPSRKSRVM
jgi:class 3 adenylate cyclase